MDVMALLELARDRGVEVRIRFDERHRLFIVRAEKRLPDGTPCVRESAATWLDFAAMADRERQRWISRALDVPVPAAV